MDFRDSLFSFLLIEIELAITFAEIARDTNDEEKRARNLKNALTAHKAVLGFMNKNHLTASQRTELEPLLDRLKEILAPFKTAA